MLQLWVSPIRGFVPSLVCLMQVYTMPVFEAIETGLARYAAMLGERPMPMRATVRTVYVLAVTLVAAMLPFFADLMGLIGALGFLPSTFILPPTDVCCGPQITSAAVGVVSQLRNYGCVWHGSSGGVLCVVASGCAACARVPCVMTLYHDTMCSAIMVVVELNCKQAGQSCC